MKKIITSLLVVILTGCFNATPAQAVDRYFESYQARDKFVTDQIDNYTNAVPQLSAEQKDEYRGILERQLDFLTYNIKDETIDGNAATAKVEIHVYDYQRVVNDAEEHVSLNVEEFYDDNGNFNYQKYNLYLIDKLKTTSDTITYTLNLELSKNVDENRWDIEPLSSPEVDKIYGLY